VRAARIWQIVGVGSVALAGALSACGVGERPTLAAATAVGGRAGTPTGNAAADAVLQLLEGDPAPAFTAHYTIATKFARKTTQATVARSGDRRSITIGKVRFLSDGREQTCNVDTGRCVDGIQEARVSDTAVTSEFSAASPARQLRVSLARRTGEPTGSSASVADHLATCVTTPVGDRRELTCASTEGILATWDTASVHVELTRLTDTVDPSAFTTAG
jgi:hypothetical protein